jgi:type I restriction enzyme R subunit
MLNEADTRAKLIDPKLKEAGWTEDNIEREKPVTKGKIINENGVRLSPKKIDYVLYYPDIYTGIPIAVIEAKEESKSHLEGMEQAKEYSEMLLAPFAYSTNGHKIEEYDNFTKRQITLDRFPTPEELRRRYIKERELKEVEERKETNPLYIPYYPFPRKPMRYYQEVAIRCVIESIIKGNKRVLLTMATGSGKTYVAVQVVWKLYKTGKIKRVLYVVDRDFLRTQAFSAFEPFGNAREIIKGGEINKAKEIYIATYQTLYSEIDDKRFYELFDPNFFDMVIIDECHRSGWKRWHDILKHFSNAIQFGMTATPKRTDNIDVYEYFGKPVYEYPMSRGIEDGFLAPCMDIRRIFTNVDKAGGINITEVKSSGGKIEVPPGVEVKDYYTVKEFEREILLPERNKIICQYIAKFLESVGPKSKTIIFCVSQNHAREVAKELNNWFNPKFKIDNYAVPIIAEEPFVHDVLRTVFASSEKDFPVVATTVDLLSTGVDIPPVKNIIFLKPVNSKVEFHQIIGRATRIDDTAGKYGFKILDFTNVTRLFDSWDLPEEFTEEKRYSGPKDWYLSCRVIDSDTGNPIKKASVLIMVEPGKPINVPTDDEGLILMPKMPRGSIKVDISASGYKRREIVIPTFPTPDKIVTVNLFREIKKEKELIKVTGVEVYIEEEGTVKVDIKGNRLAEAEYIKYTKDNLAEKITTLEDLKKIWKNPKERKGFKEDLKKIGINLDLIAKLIDNPDVDEFDLIAHFLFDAPLVTRDERAKALLMYKREILEKYGPYVRDIMMELIDRYRLFGIDEITTPKIFKTPPFDRMGYLKGMIKLFGGIDKLKNAISDIEKGIYPEVFESRGGN